MGRERGKQAEDVALLLVQRFAQHWLLPYQGSATLSASYLLHIGSGLIKVAPLSGFRHERWLACHLLDIGPAELSQ